MKKIFTQVMVMLLLLTLVGGVTYSVFTTQGRVAGNQFMVGHADLALFKDLAQGTAASNLTKVLPGSTFDNLIHNAQRQIALKLTNTGSLALTTVLEAQAIGAITTPDLREAIKVTVKRWTDNGNGTVEESELSAPLETKTLAQWIAAPFVLGLLTPSQVAGYVLQFTVNDLENAYQGASTTLDFVFNATASN